MGLVREILTDAVGFIREEILPVRGELVKAGLLSPPSRSDPQFKSSLTDPWSYNTMNYGYKEKFSFLDYERAKQVSVADPVLSAIILTRQNQIAGQSVVQQNRFQNGFKVRMRDKEAKPSRIARKKIKELESFISTCGYPETFEDTPLIKRRDSFETFLRKIVRDTLSYDQVNFEIVPRRNGLPGQFLAVDASTIRIVPDLKERESMFAGYDKEAARNGENFMSPQVVGPQDNVAIAKYPRFVQVVQGTIRASYDEWEMAFGIRNPRTDLLANGYGFSEIEMLITTLTAHMNADTYNRRFFSNGSAIKGFLAFEGVIPPDQLEAFRRQWHQQVSGVQNSWKTPIIALGKDGKMNWQSLHQTNKEMEWGKYTEYLIKVMCSVYQIDPIEIGFDISRQSMGSAGTGGLGQGDSDHRIGLSKEKGLAPLLRFIASMMNDYLIWRIDPDFEFEFPLANKEDEAVDLAGKQVKTFKTINEIRAEYDMDPLPEIDKMKGPGDIIMAQEFMTALTTMGNQGGPQAPGAPPEAGIVPEGQEGQAAAPEAPEAPEEEPDYQNMSTEDLEKELARLKGQGEETQKSETLEYLL